MGVDPPGIELRGELAQRGRPLTTTRWPRHLRRHLHDTLDDLDRRATPKPPRATAPTLVAGRRPNTTSGSCRGLRRRWHRRTSHMADVLPRQ